MNVKCEKETHIHAVNCATSSDCSVLIHSAHIMKFMEVDNIAMKK